MEYLILIFRKLEMIDFSTTLNAALEIFGGDEREDVVVVEILDSSWDSHNETLVYTTNILPAANGTLSQYHERMESGIPAAFDDVTTFY